MDSKLKQQYIERVNTANPLQLTIINYELVIHNIEEAQASENQSPQYLEALTEAYAFLAELYESLDFSVDFSNDLGALYMLSTQLITRAKLTKNPSEAQTLLGEVHEILTNLLASWQKLEQDGETGIKPQTSSTYAGLTYTKDGRLSEYEDGSPSSDYKV